MTNDDVWHWRIALRGIDWNLRSYSREVSHGDILCRRIRSSTLIIGRTECLHRSYHEIRFFRSWLVDEWAIRAASISFTSTPTTNFQFTNWCYAIVPVSLPITMPSWATSISLKIKYEDSLVTIDRLFNRDARFRSCSTSVPARVSWVCSLLKLVLNMSMLSMLAQLSAISLKNWSNVTVYRTRFKWSTNGLRRSRNSIRPSISSSVNGWVREEKWPLLDYTELSLSLGFYLFHESMLESVIYARDHFLHIASEQDDLTPDQNESIVIFPSHAYLVCWRLVFSHCWFECRFFLVLCSVRWSTYSYWTE